MWYEVNVCWCKVRVQVQNSAEVDEESAKTRFQNTLPHTSPTPSFGGIHASKAIFLFSLEKVLGERM